LLIFAINETKKMKKEFGKIIKVTFEYENATLSLSGEQAEKWFDTVNDMCVMLNPFQTETIDWLENLK